MLCTAHINPNLATSPLFIDKREDVVESEEPRLTSYTCYPLRLCQTPYGMKELFFSKV